MSENVIIRIILNGRTSYFVEGGISSPLVTTIDITEASKYNLDLMTIVKSHLRRLYPTAKIDIINP